MHTYHIANYEIETDFCIENYEEEDEDICDCPNIVIIKHDNN